MHCFRRSKGRAGIKVLGEEASLEETVEEISLEEVWTNIARLKNRKLHECVV